MKILSGRSWIVDVAVLIRKLTRTRWWIERNRARAMERGKEAPVLIRCYLALTDNTGGASARNLATIMVPRRFSYHGYHLHIK